MKKNLMNRLAMLATASLLSMQMWGCGSSGTGSSSATSSASLVGANDLVVVSPTAQSSGSASISAGLRSSMLSKMVSTAESPANDEDLGVLNYEEKLAQIDAIRNATTLEGCFNFQIAPYRSGLPATCYGPTVVMSGTHPDGTIDNSDLEAVPPVFGNNPLPSGDLGLWNDVNMVNGQDTTEACAAAKLNSIFNSATAPIDNAQFFQASMQCMMRIRNIELPDINENIDFTDIITDGLANIAQAPTVSEASFTRGADDSNGKPVYIFAMTLTDSFSFNNQSVSITSDYLFNHSPQDDTNSLYRGRLLMKTTSSGLANLFGNCSGCSQATIATSAIYSKESESSINVRVRYAIFGNNPSFSDLVNSNGELDFTKKYDQEGSPPATECPDTTVTRSTTGWSDDGNQLTLNINPINQAIVASAAWQAGRNDCNTRVFNATVTPQSDGSATGVAYFGFGPDAAAASGLGEISGMICNWAGPGSGTMGNKDFNSLAQKQSFSLNTTSGLFEPTASNILYAPTNNCDVSGSLVYNAVDGNLLDSPVISMDNNNAGGIAVENNLVDDSDISSNFTMPTITGDFSFD